MDPSVFIDLFLYLSTVSNVWLICIIFYWRPKNQSGYLLLLHLSVADLVHDFHACLFKVSNSLLDDFFKEETLSRETWILQHVYFGYAVSLVSVLAVLWSLFTEFCHSVMWPMKLKMAENDRNILLKRFGASHGYLWSLSLIISFVIITSATNCEHYM